jgi:hypothetical protein
MPEGAHRTDWDPGTPAEVTKDVPDGPRPKLRFDITFEETPSGYEIWYSDRIANERSDLVDESADWLENEMGVLNLGQIDHRQLIADGVLTDQISNGLITWWAERVQDLDLGP